MLSLTTYSGQTVMPIPESGPKNSRRLARDDAYNKLRGWIIDGTLKPEEGLHDQHIAALLGVSRTPVREACRLEDEGLVETALNRWTRVAPLDLNSTAEKCTGQCPSEVQAAERISLWRAGLLGRGTGSTRRALRERRRRSLTDAARVRVSPPRRPALLAVCRFGAANPPAGAGVSKEDSGRSSGSRRSGVHPSRVLTLHDEQVAALGHRGEVLRRVPPPGSPKQSFRFSPSQV